jgi:hypothetical protein
MSSHERQNIRPFASPFFSVMAIVAYAAVELLMLFIIGAAWLKLLSWLSILAMGK